VASTRARCSIKQRGDHRRRGFEWLELLQVIEHEQETLATEVGEHALLQAEPASFAHTQHGRDSRQEQLRDLDSCQRYQEYAIGKRLQ